MKTILHTDDYVRSHGHAPRGVGNWMIEVGLYCPARGYLKLPAVCLTGSLADAKKAAKERAAAEASTIGGKFEVVLNVMP